MGFGKEIQRLRKTKPKLSVQKMADAIGIDADRQRKWEEKDMDPRYEDAKIIEDFFGLSLEKIMGLENLNNYEFVPHETNNEDYLNQRRNQKNGTMAVLRQLPFDPIPNTDIDIGAASGPDLELYDDINSLSEDYYYIPEFSGCRAFNVYADSMEPRIPKGSKIFARKVENWQAALELGQIYAIGLHDGRRFLKVIKKSPEGKAFFLLHSANTEYDDWDLPKELIRSVWLIDGWMNKATQSTYFVLKTHKNNKKLKQL